MVARTNRFCDAPALLAMLLVAVSGCNAGDPASTFKRQASPLAIDWTQRIYGVVAQGAPVSGARVTLRDRTGKTASAVADTDASGFFYFEEKIDAFELPVRLSALLPGGAKLAALAESFGNWSITPATNLIAFARCAVRGGFKEEASGWNCQDGNENLPDRTFQGSVPTTSDASNVLSQILAFFPGIISGTSTAGGARSTSWGGQDYLADPSESPEDAVFEATRWETTSTALTIRNLNGAVMKDLPLRTMPYGTLDSWFASNPTVIPKATVDQAIALAPAHAKNQNIYPCLRVFRAANGGIVRQEMSCGTKDSCKGDNDSAFAFIEATRFEPHTTEASCLSTCERNAQIGDGQFATDDGPACQYHTVCLGAGPMLGTLVTGTRCERVKRTDALFESACPETFGHLTSKLKSVESQLCGDGTDAGTPPGGSLACFGIPSSSWFTECCGGTSARFGIECGTGAAYDGGEPFSNRAATWGGTGCQLSTGSTARCGYSYCCTGGLGTIPPR